MDINDRVELRLTPEQQAELKRILEDIAETGQITTEQQQALRNLIGIH